MEGIKSLAVGVCTSMIVFGTISLLIPEGSLNKTLKSLLSVALIAVVIGGVSGVDIELESVEFGENTVSDSSEQLKETVVMQELSVTKTAFEQYISDELEKNGVLNAEITVNADISDKGDIYITEVNIVCEKGQFEICQGVVKPLNINTKITERE